MLTSWVALLGLMEKVISGAGDGDAEVEIKQLRGVLDRMDENICRP